MSDTVKKYHDNLHYFEQNSIEKSPLDAAIKEIGKLMFSPNTTQEETLRLGEIRTMLIQMK